MADEPQASSDLPVVACSDGAYPARAGPHPGTQPHRRERLSSGPWGHPCGVGLDRSLDDEGIPDLEGPLPEKVATGDPQEGAPPPTDHPAAADYGVTAAEQGQPEPLDQRLGRELPDTEVHADDRSPVLVAPEDEELEAIDDEKDMVARATDAGTGGLSAEEAAVHVVDES